MTSRIRDILSWYQGQPPGVINNLARLLLSGRLAGSGKLVILPVDQGFEHGPVRSFAKVPAGNDPRYHFDLAVAAGVSAHAAPLGALEAGAVEYAGLMPTILKLNNSDTLADVEPCSAITGSVDDALRLGCVGIGFTIYPGSAARNVQYDQIRALIAEARARGLVSVVWSYPRGANLSKAGETALDVVAYGAHIAAQLGAHIIKVKPPSAHIEQAEAKKIYEAERVACATLVDRVRHVVGCCFGGRRIVIFSGGVAKGDAEVLEEVRALHDGGAFGSIMGRNVFQRPRPEALGLLGRVMDVFAAT